MSGHFGALAGGAGAAKILDLAGHSTPNVTPPDITKSSIASRVREAMEGSQKTRHERRGHDRAWQRGRDVTKEGNFLRSGNGAPDWLKGIIRRIRLHFLLELELSGRQLQDAEDAGRDRESRDGRRPAEDIGHDIGRPGHVTNVRGEL